jgi:CRISPR/Cas system endoribonuclease Cas6 (RAMP superfamily)
MRLCLTLSANRQPVPFSYQHFLTGAFHRWLGPNAVHDAMSLYSLSWLRGEGSFMRRGCLHFPRGAQWRISAHDPALLQKIIEGSLRGPEVCCGMRVETVEQLPCPTFGERHTFRLLSPVLAKSRPDAQGRLKTPPGNFRQRITTDCHILLTIALHSWHKRQFMVSSPNYE